LREALCCCLALADEFRLVTEFAQDRVEHDAAERIVLDAEQPQCRRRACRSAIASFENGLALGLRQHDIQGEGGAAALALGGCDVTAHGAGKLFDR